jgi:LysR family hydrogen peroxide-inducible transcriptional activator
MTGLVRLGAIPTIAPYVLPRLVRALRDRHPELRAALREDQTEPLLARVREGRLDFALTPCPTTPLQVRELASGELCSRAPGATRRSSAPTCASRH